MVQLPLCTSAQIKISPTFTKKQKNKNPAILSIINIMVENMFYFLNTNKKLELLGASNIEVIEFATVHKQFPFFKACAH